MSADRGAFAEAADYTDVGKALGTDYFLIRDELTEAEVAQLERARRFVDEEVLPVIGDYWERAELPWELICRLGELELVGDGIDGHDCPDMTPLAAGLVNMEINRGDGSLGPSSESRPASRCGRSPGWARRAEAPLAAGAGARRGDRRLCADRA